MDIIHQLRIQILDQLRKSGFVRSFQELNSNASSWVAIKACILSGLYPQVARACRSGKLTTRREASVRLHTASALLGEKVESGSQKKAVSHLPSEWMVYEEISRQVSKEWTKVNPSWTTVISLGMVGFWLLSVASLWSIRLRWQFLEGRVGYPKSLSRSQLFPPIAKMTMTKTMMTTIGQRVRLQFNPFKYDF